MTNINEIRAARLNSGLTQKQAAEKCGVPFRTYQDWEYGRRNPPDYTKQAVIERLKEGN